MHNFSRSDFPTEAVRGLGLAPPESEPPTSAIIDINIIVAYLRLLMNTDSPPAGHRLRAKSRAPSLLYSKVF